MKIGYLGPEGSYSYMAGKEYDPKSELIPMKTFRQIINSVELGEIDRGILPIENSTEGAVTEVMDALMTTKSSKIQGEVILQVRHNLLSIEDNAKKLKYIISHPQAIEQCREFFAKHYPQVVFIPCDSTSSACKLAKEKGSQYGAIANNVAAQKNGLKILNNNIQDNCHNQTRFVVIGEGNQIPTGRDKTSIAFSFHDDFPGSLYMILKEFADENINLTRIESRPAKSEMGKYIFYIDFNGHQKDIKSKIILDNIEKKTRKLKVFGSYPIGEIY